MNTAKDTIYGTLQNRKIGTAFSASLNSMVGLYFLSLNLSDGIIHGYITQPLLTLLCMVAVADRELIQKPIEFYPSSRDNVEYSRLAYQSQKL